jgi:hypothetical protein
MRRGKTRTLVVMDAAATATSTPARRYIRASTALTGLAVIIAAVLLFLPSAWLRNVVGPLFFALLGSAGAAVVVAVIAALSRGANQSAGSAIVLIGLNVIVTLVVVVALFSFRMGAP